jgi:N-acetylmuramoyl-L-alanine amidase
MLTHERGVTELSKIIALDNGHGLNTAGKRTPKWTDGTKSLYTKKDFMHEWEFNRGVVKRLKDELKRCGFRVVEVSPGEEDITITKRCKLANAAKADLFVSVHANALGNVWNERVGGIETLTAKAGEGLKAGKLIQKHMVEASGLRDRGMKDGSWLGVVKMTRMPAVLVECGFMDNPAEAKMLNMAEYRSIMAKAIARGICDYFKVEYK